MTPDNREESKASFSEEKKQKTFHTAVAEVSAARALGNKSFLVLFFKKEPLCLLLQVNTGITAVSPCSRQDSFAANLSFFDGLARALFAEDLCELTGTTRPDEAVCGKLRKPSIREVYRRNLHLQRR